MPMACPFTAATTGLRISQAVGRTGEEVNWSGPVAGVANVSAAGVRSAPAQKASPAPVTTTGGLVVLVAAAGTARPRLGAHGPVNALRRSGRVSRHHRDTVSHLQGQVTEVVVGEHRIVWPHGFDTVGARLRCERCGTEIIVVKGRRG